VGSTFDAQGKVPFTYQDDILNAIWSTEQKNVVKYEYDTKDKQYYAVITSVTKFTEVYLNKDDNSINYVKEFTEKTVTKYEIIVKNSIRWAAGPYQEGGAYLSNVKSSTFEKSTKNVQLDKCNNVLIERVARAKLHNIRAREVQAAKAAADAYNDMQKKIDDHKDFIEKTTPPHKPYKAPTDPY